MEHAGRHDVATNLAASSRDAHLVLRRVERHQVIVERLSAARGRLVPFAVLGRELSVSPRTIARDVERLRSSGIPLRTRRGRAGGVSLPLPPGRIALTLDFPEMVALMSSLAALGPTATESAASAMRKLTAAFDAAGATDH
ncbi:helix-turn-helix transcriptional regulator [Cryptosporangium minutisporangium]|uniref:Helix-turn-helix type 11 domain-containing protein n=1 Tax=Cryptosporangium minutisporangium TaxID=113569 RepID=A0ABP6SP45_9ACTN